MFIQFFTFIRNVDKGLFFTQVPPHPRPPTDRVTQARPQKGRPLIGLKVGQEVDNPDLGRVGPHKLGHDTPQERGFRIAKVISAGDRYVAAQRDDDLRGLSKLQVMSRVERDDHIRMKIARNPPRLLMRTAYLISYSLVRAINDVNVW
ncbi:hypothetical protein CEXT_490831 [Caerostris extrusa]|uniref:Uncharacterized protein n=1 Tax=Caerostris extrusa TaxID=172846 RepID=A0AAV4XNP6_CAEEX|nr:hypothetical protein CEXT_490831 [Caerostris extrusa]